MCVANPEKGVAAASHQAACDQLRSKCDDMLIPSFAAAIVSLDCQVSWHIEATGLQYLLHYVQPTTSDLNNVPN